jgi:heat shock protein HslJ
MRGAATRRLMLAAAVAFVAQPGFASEPGSAQGAWVAVEIGGAAVAEGVASTLEIGADGAVSGSGGCNRYRGRAEIAAGTITFSPLAATRMACPGAAMAQEQRFFAALAAARRFRVDAGRIVLLAEDGSMLALLRRAG